MQAHEGSQRGSLIEGELILQAPSAQDRSPTTGAAPRDPGDIPLFWGWTEAPVEAVGAPLCEYSRSSPQSRDPVYPGALVFRAPPNFYSQQPINAPILLLATSSNRRDGTLSLDGCGVGLFVQGSDSGRFWGRWKEWGLEYDGRGTFCIERQPLDRENGPIMP